MGLCKCPKRRVTNLFCFEHRVNVCEHCLISKHSKCIVQSYLQWLQDSDYSPSCRLCNAPLADDDTVRLVCYDLFHWSCLNEMAARLPKNTAPAGYQCPSCSGPVFPPANMVSPVASVLKERLSTVNWARAGLGLPLIEEEELSQEQESLDTTDATDWSSFSVHGVGDHTARSPALPSSSFTSLQEYREDPGGNTKAERAQDVGPGSEAISMSTGTAHVSSPRKVYDTIARDTARSTAVQLDFDDDKYRRRPALTWFARWFRNTTASKRRPLSRLQRLLAVLVVGVLAFLTLVVVMSRLGRASVENDPNWDLMQNPHIQVGAE
ncbi:zinc finger protein-like 1 [Pristis pectinata]|uniref:zinc finger protein-like 1 n=1 Tax=Pristis pectinata TaxID=685728 RepID=UPI00223D47BF|nr:zinc finger protein-like 1 [Pristis pectinata]